MEKERITTELNEGSLNKKNHLKEFSYLNQFKGHINFDLYSKATLCESNFYETIAWYIDYLQKDNESTREKEIQDFINSIINFKGSDTQKLKYIEDFFRPKKISRLEKNGRQSNANLLKLRPGEIEIYERMYLPKKDGKITAIFPGIVAPAIPERYYTRFTESGVEAKVIGEHRQNFINAMRHGMEKSEELKKDL